MISIAAIVFIMGLNLVTVKLFGEMEFWFALIKIIAIIVLIAVGLWMIFTGFTSDAGTVASFTHIWSHGGLFPTGTMGFLAGFQIAIFAFVGVELVGTTAAETKDPEKNLPKAVNSIPVRIIIFYVLALLIVMSVTPWNQIDPNISPFVNLFSQTQINRMVESVVANVKAFTVSGTKYCNAAPNSRHTAEKYNALAGTARLFKRPKALGPCCSRDRPNSIRLVENTPLFIDDITEDSTTRFMIIAAAAIPA